MELDGVVFERVKDFADMKERKRSKIIIRKITEEIIKTITKEWIIKTKRP